MLDGCNLSQGELGENDLKGASLKGAKVYRLDMRKSNLDGATLKDATGEGMLLGGAVLCNTTMPDGQIVWSGCSP